MAERLSENTPCGYGPGGRLLHAREALGMSVEEAAKALRLSPRHILALENDDYEHLPEPTYVRGYLRSYAQLLGLPADEVIACYNRLAVAHRPADLGRFAPPQEIVREHRLMRAGSFLVLGLFVALAAIWWYGHEGRPPATPEPLAAGRPEASAPAAGEDPAVPPSQAASRAHALEETVPPVSDATASRAAAPVPDRMPAHRDAGQTRPAPATVAAAPVLEGSPRSRLVLRTLQDCWADVRDAAGNRLLYETIQAGRTVSVEGAAPLSVFLGNVDGVRVEFNDMPYDAARHRRGQVARFTLGEPQTVRP